jgi:protein SCO1/2
MKLYRGAILLSISLLLSACGENAPVQPTFSTIDITNASWGKGFNLTDHHGKQRSLEDFRGQVVALFFGYANCPDVCPTTMARLAASMQALGKDAQRVQVLMVTLDPHRDTPQVLKQYVPAFHPTFLGLYGDEKATSEAAKEFRLVYQRQKPGESGFYTVDHSGGIYVFDPQGRIRLFMTDEHTTEAITGDLRTVLRQSDALGV